MKLPKNWEEKELGKIAEVNDRDHRTPTYLEQGIPLISPKDFTSFGVNFGKPKYVSELEYQNFVKKCKPEKGDILYSRIGTIGEARLIEEDGQFVALHSIAVVKPDHKKILPKYLLYFLKSSNCRQQAKKGTKSIGTPDLGLKEIKKFRIPVPPLPVQKRIVSILSRAERLKEKRKRANELMKQLPQSIFMEMFGDPYDSKYLIEELKDICELKKGSSITKKKVDNGNIPVIAGGRTPAYYHNEANREGDIITVSASGAYAGFVNYFNTPIFASDCTTIKTLDENKVLTKYVFFMLKIQQNYIYSIQIGAGQPHIYPKDLKKLKIPVPPLSEQKRFITRIKRLESLDSTVEKSRGEISLLFDSLMQKAFNGELVS